MSWQSILRKLINLEALGSTLLRRGRPPAPRQKSQVYALWQYRFMGIANGNILGSIIALTWKQQFTKDLFRYGR